MRLFLVLVMVFILSGPAAAETEVAMPFPTYDAMKEDLAIAVEAGDVDTFWNTLRDHDMVPFIRGEQVAFFYRGEDGSVSFPGDFNGWEPGVDRAERLGDTDLWLHETTFPTNARLDYKIVLNGKQWILDPANPRKQLGGFGDNSEVRMPDYFPSKWVHRRDGVPTGEITPASITSSALGHPLSYQVYTPPGYENLADLPVMYVTDGHAYADDRMGSMVPVMDNLIHEGKLRPMMAVFIDMRVYGKNLRGDLLIMNPDFVTCVAEELVPIIDDQYRTSTDRWDRGMLGTSLGGLNSAWFAYQAHAVFGRIAIQSPAFHAGDGRIVGLFKNSPRLDVDIFMSWGTFNDFGETTRRFKNILDDKGYEYRHVVVNEGHSWGNWRALLDDVLVGFWPAE